MSKGASPKGDRATHERSLKSPPTVGIPSAALVELADAEKRGDFDMLVRVAADASEDADCFDPDGSGDYAKMDALYASERAAKAELVAYVLENAGDMRRLYPA